MRRSLIAVFARHGVLANLLIIVIFALGDRRNAGPTGGGYDLPGIGWTCLFSGDGVAIHSTFWHNNFGVPMSHGCINFTIADAGWVYNFTVVGTVVHLHY